MFISEFNFGRELRKEEKQVVTTTASFAYWMDMLFEKCMRIFVWKELPFPQKELEMRTLYDGYSGFVDDGIKGLMIASGSMSGPTQYFDEFTHFTYAAATARGGSKRIGEDCVIIPNTSLRNSIMPLIERYASLLAHADVTLKMALVNLRAVDTFSAEDGAVAESIKSYYNDVYEGKTSCIIDDSMVEGIKNIASSHSGSIGVSEAIEARNELLRSFFAEIGVNYSRDKKERMVVDEVSSNNQMLLLNINDMLNQRKDACEQINDVFGLNVSVDFSDEFKLLMESYTESEDDEDVTE